MEKTPELTKEEYIRLELVKAYIAVMPNLMTSVISDYVNRLTDGILNPQPVNFPDDSSLKS